jgi:hypothetical protein
MKRLLLLVSLFFSIGCVAQTPSGYTKINQRYHWTAGWFDQLGINPKDTTTAPTAVGEIRIQPTTYDMYVCISTSTSPKWRLIASGDPVSSGDFVETIRIGSAQNLDTVFQTIGGVESIVGYIDKQDGLISGGVVTWSGTGLTFDVSAATYRIDGTRYTSAAGSVTLAAADATNPRIDVVAVNTSGVIAVLTGTPAANPVEPQIDPATQVYLTSVLVAAGATTPSNISSSTIYDENTEWTGSASGVTVNFNNTSNVFNGSKSADVGAWTAGQSFSFTNATTVSAAAYSALKFYIRLKGSVASTANIQLSFVNGSTVVSNSVNLSTTYGFSKTTINTYQTIAIPFSAFTFTSGSFDRLKITLSGTGGFGFYLDYVQLQSGTGGSSSAGLQNAYTFFTDGTTTTTATGPSTFKLRSADNKLSIALTDNNPTHGDNALFTINQANFSLSSIGGSLSLSQLAQGGATSNQVLQWNGSVWAPTTLSNSTPGIDDVLAVGQALTSDRTLSTTTHKLTISTSSAGVNPLYVSSVSDYAIRAQTTNAIALSAQSTNDVGVSAYSGALEAIVGTSQPAASGSVSPILRLTNAPQSTPSNGVGSSLDFFTNTNGGGDYSNKLVSKWTDATHATRTSEFSITGVSSGSAQTVFSVGGQGYVKLLGLSATMASALTPAAGMIVFVTSTDGTFTSVGFWGYDGSAWSKF